MSDENSKSQISDFTNRSTLEQLTRLVLDFREERDWRQFHNPKDMALSLSLEAGEVLELMQWRNGSELDAHLKASKDRLGEELADVLGWILLMAHDQQIDLGAAFAKKIELNKSKYPIEKARGSARKYTEYNTKPGPSGSGPAA
jgi:NTP pyrophosphatase (non-canonical NTP hydrolase)